MKLRPDQLDKHLTGPLQPIYLVTGDDPLQMQEATDAIRQSARNQHYTERQVLDVDASFKWDELYASTQSMSLFAEKKIIELRLTGKAGKDGSQAISDFCDAPPDDTLLLISSPRLDRSAQRAKWVKAIETQGVLITIWPVERHDLPRWLQHRAKRLGLNLEWDAVQLLADRVEGNLLAAAQELEKLYVLAGDKAVSAEAINSLVASSARYDVFKLIEKAMNGEAVPAIRMLHSLRREGAEAIQMMGAINLELRKLLSCSEQIASGNGIERVLDNAGVWDKRKPLFKSTLSRLNTQDLSQLLVLSQTIDLSQKGQRNANSWDLMEQLITSLAGTRLAVSG